MEKSGVSLTHSLSQVHCLTLVSKLNTLTSLGPPFLLFPVLWCRRPASFSLLDLSSSCSSGWRALGEGVCSHAENGNSTHQAHDKYRIVPTLEDSDLEHSLSILILSVISL